MPRKSVRTKTRRSRRQAAALKRQKDNTDLASTKGGRPTKGRRVDTFFPATVRLHEAPVSKEAVPSARLPRAAKRKAASAMTAPSQSGQRLRGRSAATGKLLSDVFGDLSGISDNSASADAQDAVQPMDTGGGSSGKGPREARDEGNDTPSMSHDRRSSGRRPSRSGKGKRKLRDEGYVSFDSDALEAAEEEGTEDSKEKKTGQQGGAGKKKKKKRKKKKKKKKKKKEKKPGEASKSGISTVSSVTLSSLEMSSSNADGKEDVPQAEESVRSRGLGRRRAAARVKSLNVNDLWAQKRRDGERQKRREKKKKEYERKRRRKMQQKKRKKIVAYARKTGKTIEEVIPLPRARKRIRRSLGSRWGDIDPYNPTKRFRGLGRPITNAVHVLPTVPSAEVPWSLITGNQMLIRHGDGIAINPINDVREPSKPHQLGYLLDNVVFGEPMTRNYHPSAAHATQWQLAATIPKGRILVETPGVGAMRSLRAPQAPPPAGKGHAKRTGKSSAASRRRARRARAHKGAGPRRPLTPAEAAANVEALAEAMYATATAKTGGVLVPAETRERAIQTEVTMAPTASKRDTTRALKAAQGELMVPPLPPNMVYVQERARDAKRTRKLSSAAQAANALRLSERGHKMLQGDARWSEGTFINCDLRYFNLKSLGTFDIVYIDPPWRIRGSQLPTMDGHIFSNSRRQMTYDTMSNEDIMDLDVGSIVKSGLCFLWTITSQLATALACLEKWGFTFIDKITWVRLTPRDNISMGIGYYLLHSSELCLIGTKSPPGARIEILPKVTNDVIFERVRRSGQKPLAMYDIMERMMPGARRIELFARNNNLRRGWLSLGNHLGRNFDYIKDHVVCDGCRRDIAVGNTRYKSRIFPDVDFCHPCFTKQSHVWPEKYFIKMDHLLSDMVFHNNFTCDRCAMNPICGIRFRCTRCEYDVCEGCFDATMRIWHKEREENGVQEQICRRAHALEHPPATIVTPGPAAASALAPDHAAEPPAPMEVEPQAAPFAQAAETQTTPSAQPAETQTTPSAQAAETQTTPSAQAEPQSTQAAPMEIEPQATQGEPQTTQAAPMEIEPQTTQGEPQTTQGEPQTTQGEPQTTQGEPQTTQGEPQTTQGEPQTTQGEPQTTQGEGEPQTTQGEPQTTQGEPQTTQGEGEPQTTQGEGEPQTAEEATHPQTHVFVAYEDVDPSGGLPVHHARCVSCLDFPIIGYRFFCLECPSLDLCQKCFFLKKTPREHHPDHVVHMLAVPENPCQCVRCYTDIHLHTREFYKNQMSVRSSDQQRRDHRAQQAQQSQ